MKYITILTFLIISTLWSNDEIVLIDDIQSTLSQIETLPDATLLDTQESIVDQQEIILNQNDNYTDITTLPDATIVEIIEPEEILPENHIQYIYEEIITDKNNSDIDIQSIPDATILETIVEQSPVDIENDLNQSSVTIIESNQTVYTHDKNITQLSEKKSDQNSSNIIIVKTLEEDSTKETDDETKKEEIDFWSLLNQTLTNSTQLILKKYDIAITKENMQIIKGEYYPNVSLSYSGEYYHSYEKGDASIDGSYYPSYSQYSDSIGLSMQYELYRFGATDLMMKISQKDLDIIKTELALTKEEVSKRLLEYFKMALKSQELIKYKEKMLLIQDTILQKKRRLYEVGKTTKVALAKDELSMSTLEKEIMRHKLDFKDAVKKIQILSNLELDPNHIQFIMFEPKNCKTKSFEESMIAKNLQLHIEKKKHELALLEKDYLPGFYLSSGYRLYGSDENNFIQSIENLERNSWNIGLSIKWNIFNGYKTDAKITRSKLELQQLIEQYRLAKIDFESREEKRELLKKTFDKILQAEYKIIDQTFQQEEMYARLQSAGQIDTIQLDYIQISKYKNELSFRLSVIDKVYETISSELII